MDTMPPAHDVQRQGSSDKNRGPLPSAETGADEPWQQVPREGCPEPHEQAFQGDAFQWPGPLEPHMSLATPGTV